jgi:hypothetical protein
MPGMAEMLELLPTLPSERAHILTPSPSREELCQRVAARSADSTFFQHLPYEIRRRILVDAFGGRTVHMDLRFGYPEAPRGDDAVESDARAATHCNRNRMDRYERVPWDPKYLELDVSKPKEWIWSSSVCHRVFPNKRTGKFYYEADPNVAEDRCRFGGYRTLSWFYCQGYGVVHNQCFLGIMGWLLSCRQA